MIKILVDRVIPTSERIKKRQDFDSILKQHQRSKLSTIVPWYFGAVGFASFIIAIVSILS